MNHPCWVLEGLREGERKLSLRGLRGGEEKREGLEL